MLRRFRHLREELGEARVEGFAERLVAETAAGSGCTPDEVRAIVSRWIDRHPLPYLRRSRYAGLPELFAGLRRHGKTIGVLSDYPAVAKLAALELAADHVVTADDPEIGVLKPHPKGLATLIERANATPAATLMIGDRAERDGLVAQQVGARVLLRASRPIAGWQTFARFDDPLFAPMLGAEPCSRRGSARAVLPYRTARILRVSRNEPLPVALKLMSADWSGAARSEHERAGSARSNVA